MKVAFLLSVLAVSALAAPATENELKRTLQLMHVLEERTIFDKHDDTPIPDPAGRIADLLAGEYSDIAGTIVSAAEPERLSDLIKEAMKILFEAIAPEQKQTILGRFIEGYVDHVVYAEKNIMYDTAGEIIDDAYQKKTFRRIMNTIRKGMRFPETFEKREGSAATEESSGPYVFGIFDAVNFYMLDPADEVVKDIYNIVYSNNDEYLGGMYYDIEGLLDEGFADKTVEEAINELVSIVQGYMVESTSPVDPELLQTLGARVMEYGRQEQALDAKETPPVRGLSEADMETWAKVYKNFKKSNKFLSHAIRRVAKYTQKDKMENLSKELTGYIVDLLVPGSNELETLGTTK